MKCTNCGKPAAYKIEGDGGALYLCVDCKLKYEYAQALEYQRNAHLLNQLSAAFDVMSGIPGIAPRVPVPQLPPLRSNEMTVNNIKVDNSVIGVLNTGNIETVDTAVTVLRESGATPAAAAITDLTQAVINSTEVPDEQKNEILEILSAVATEATEPKEKRRDAVIRPLLTQLATWFSALAGLDQLWDKYSSTITSLFQ